MPDDVADEKAKTLLALGANIEKVRPASIVDKKQVRAFCNNKTEHHSYLRAVCGTFCLELSTRTGP